MGPLRRRLAAANDEDDDTQAQVQRATERALRAEARLIGFREGLAAQRGNPVPAPPQSSEGLPRGRPESEARKRRDRATVTPSDGEGPEGAN